MASTLKRFLIGRPLATDEADHQRISKTIGLAVFSSDAISSTAYATEEILLVLVRSAASAVLARSTHLAPDADRDPRRDPAGPRGATATAQTIHAYPDGGGAYVVSRENLGEIPSLVAGGSLLVDYVLTVAVSIAAGVLAIYSAFPELEPYRVVLCLGLRRDPARSATCAG